jgi:hypothetical protein
MSPEKQRIKIAEALGWKYVTHSAPLWSSESLKGVRQENLGIMKWEIIPNYLNDLNAMRRAEAVCLRPITGEDQHTIDAKWVLWDRYIDVLASMMGRDDVAHAGAGSRAEAFLKTLNLWEE